METVQVVLANAYERCPTRSGKPGGRNRKINEKLIIIINNVPQKYMHVYFREGSVARTSS